MSEILEQFEIEAPPPESLADDGRIDGIPVRSIQDLAREERRRLVAIRRADQPRRNVGRNYTGNRIELIPEGGSIGKVYPSIRAAAKAIGVSDKNLTRVLADGGVAHGYVWKKLKTARTNK